MSVDRLLTWPGRLPATLDGLYDAVAAHLGVADVTALSPSLEGLRTARASAGRTGALLVIDAAVTSDDIEPATVVHALGRLGAEVGLDITAIVGDGYLATEHTELDAAMLAGATVTAIRSLAVRREGGNRANVVCVPDALFGRGTDQRGGLRAPVERADVADAVGFLMSDDASYLSGQVLYVDGGRHLFSSHTA